MNDSMISQNDAIVVNTQYIKDLSFENPHAPGIYLRTEQPRIDIALDINATAVSEKSFEVALGVQAKASINDDVVFLIELQYAGIFTLNNIDESEKEKLLLVSCPNIIFPYARRIISGITGDGGYPPLMIAPIDFLGLYEKRKQSELEAGNVTIN